MTQSTPSPKVLVLNGPNLNMLGTREPETYGSTTLAQVEADAKTFGAEIGLEVACFQSNHEGEMVTRIQEMRINGETGLIINAGAYTHTSIAIHDAIRSVDIRMVEIHVSNVFAREDFRHHSYLSSIADAVMAGFGTGGYRLALRHMADLL